MSGWEDALDWVSFERLVERWGTVAAADLNPIALACSGPAVPLLSGRVELDQDGWLHLRLKFIPASGTTTQLPIRSLRCQINADPDSLVA